MSSKNNQVLREISVSYSYDIKPSLLPKISSSQDAYSFLLQSWDVGKLSYIEQFKIMLLSRSNRMLGIVDISTGGCSGTVADAKVIFACALKCNAHCVVLAHNHPSGCLTPSDADKALTKNLHYIGKVMTLQVIDHIIITTEGYYSFADAGIL